MGVQQTRSMFGPRSAPAAQDDNEFVPANYFLNIGIIVGEGEEARFVSLPMGLALDTMREAKVSGTGEFAQFKASQNDLLKQVIEVAGNLNPGESLMLEGNCGGLQIELRRRNTDTPATDDSNKYKVNFTGSAPAAATADATEKAKASK